MAVSARRHSSARTANRYDYRVGKHRRGSATPVAARGALRSAARQGSGEAEGGESEVPVDMDMNVCKAREEVQRNVASEQLSKFRIPLSIVLHSSCLQLLFYKTSVSG